MSGTSPTDPHGSQNPYGTDPYGAAPQGPTPGSPGPAGASPYGQNPYGAPPAAPYGAPGQAGMPQAPSPHGPAGWQSPGPVELPPRPRSLTAAFWLIVSGGLLLLATTLLAAFAITQPEGQAAIQQELDRSVEQMNLPADQAEQMRAMMDGMLPTLATTAAVFGVLAFLVYLWVAFAIRGGSRAARIVGTVLAALSVLVLVSNAVMGAFSPLDLVWVGLGVAGIVLAYRPDATEYMRLKAWQRFARR